MAAVMNICHVWNMPEHAVNQVKSQEDSLFMYNEYIVELNLVMIVIRVQVVLEKSWQ